MEYSGEGKHGNAQLIIDVDCKNQKILVKQFDKVQFDGTFDDFINT